MKTGKKIFISILPPIITFAAVWLVCVFKGVVLFETKLNALTFFRSVANVSLVTYALSINLNSGRFDFSIGSIALLSSVISIKIALLFSAGPWVTLFLSVFFGFLFGLISGLIYVLVKLPPIIVSLAVALFYEGFAYTLTGGHGVSFASNTALLGFSSVSNYLLITAAALFIMVFTFDFTKFGYEYKALLSGQKVSVNTGIHEIPNALICYSIAGAFMGCQGFISATTNGSIQMTLNFGSISPMFMAFLPMFIGGYIGRFSNEKLGYLLGAVCSSLISLMYVRIDVTSSVQQIISALLLVGFLIWLNNEGRLRALFTAKKL